jgi:hypothetical protein
LNAIFPIFKLKAHLFSPVLAQPGIEWESEAAFGLLDAANSAHFESLLEHLLIQIKWIRFRNGTS